MNRGPLIQHVIQMVNAIVSKIFKVPNVQNVNQDTLDFLIAPQNVNQDSLDFLIAKV